MIKDIFRSIFKPKSELKTNTAVWNKNELDYNEALKNKPWQGDHFEWQWIYVKGETFSNDRINLPVKYIQTGVFANNYPTMETLNYNGYSAKDSSNDIMDFFESIKDAMDRGSNPVSFKNGKYYIDKYYENYKNKKKVANEMRILKRIFFNFLLGISLSVISFYLLNFNFSPRTLLLQTIGFSIMFSFSFIIIAEIFYLLKKMFKNLSFKKNRPSYMFSLIRSIISCFIVYIIVVLFTLKKGMPEAPIKLKNIIIYRLAIMYSIIALWVSFIGYKLEIYKSK